MEKLFKLKENNTTVKTEIMAGITTFMTMAYILAVNPNILGDPSGAGMNANGVFMATALASAFACVVMAFLANMPFVLSAGMGLNAYLSYTVCGVLGYSWQVALGAVFIEGFIFIALSLTNVREAIFNAIPAVMKTAISAGIGLFIAFIGLQNAHIVVAGSKLVGMYSWKNPSPGCSFYDEGITVILAIIGVLLTGVFTIKGAKGSILWGIIVAWGLGMLCQLAGLYVPNPEMGFNSLFPDFSHGVIRNMFAIKETAFQISLPKSGEEIITFLAVLSAFLFVDFFDTLGTIIGVASKADLLDENGKLPQIKGALMADAVGTTLGALLGTSTVTTYAESASGVAEGGKTGLTALTAGILFLVSIFFSPVFMAIPFYATSAALIVVGFLMFQTVAKIDFTEIVDAIPAFLCIMAMPLTYSIAEGIGFGMISYTVLRLLSGRGREVHAIPYIVSILFILKYIFL